MAETKKSLGRCGPTSKPVWYSFPKELPTETEVKDNELWCKINDQETLKALFAENRERAFAAVISHEGVEAKTTGVLLAAGKSERFQFYDSDTTVCPFRQEAFFIWMTGSNMPDCYLLLDLEKKESVFFYPEIPYDHQRWEGERHPPSFFLETFGFDHVHHTKDIKTIIKQRGITNLLTLQGTNNDSGIKTVTVPDFEGIEEFKVNSEFLYGLLEELRVHKTKREIDHMRLGCLVTSQAHAYVMRHIKPGMSEMQLEALFKSWCFFTTGTRHLSYTCICASGHNGATLHYGHAVRPNDKILRDGDMVVLDMGGEYRGYATDITRSYPVNRKFTPKQLIVHNAVYEAQKAVLDAMKPGVSWVAMHKLAERVILEHLIKAQVLSGTLEECIAAHMGSVFQPHGLGHLMGVLVHDVGGYTKDSPPRCSEPGAGYLRTSRNLEAGMVVTVEPGLYFNNPTLDKALANPEQKALINEEVLDTFRGMGGVRLEDDVLITETGIENFTILPTSADEIEAFLAERAL